jgi:hypothetical protein
MSCIKLTVTQAPVREPSLVEIYIAKAQLELWALAEQTLASMMLDTASGKQLDELGALVGQVRDGRNDAEMRVRYNTICRVPGAVAYMEGIA